ncbi:MAG: branched-chain amino acid ABC transporter permease [Phototrophicaceae bacterium]
MQLQALLAQVIVGISNGMLLFILAAGLTLIFGVLRLINFAHGSLYMLGAYWATSVGAFLGARWGFWGALLIVPLAVAGVGWLLETQLFKRIYAREHLLQLLLTYGITLIMGDVIRMVYGGAVYRLDRPQLLRGSIPLTLAPDFTLRILTYDVFLMGCGVLMSVGLWVFIQRTRYGRTIRAAVANREILGALGVHVDRVYTLTFLLGAWLAGLAGVLAAGRSSVSLGMDSAIIVQAFAIVVIGGLGSIPGALLGSLVVGLTLSLGLVLTPPLQTQLNTTFPALAPWIMPLFSPSALPFWAMALILIVRPRGLFNHASD